MFFLRSLVRVGVWGRQDALASALIIIVQFSYVMT